ncbi:hypothetical protein GS938_20085 [Rhodococcus hoagii]|nr:hypothetical protein [Prescottella equi]NKV95331.1 hypothetical protein [Prescottella equi]NKW07667.1 hypothetical protein [Prescottella equi]NKW08034.1 hypothetical protein [Prescottella equi]
MTDGIIEAAGDLVPGSPLVAGGVVTGALLLRKVFGPSIESVGDVLSQWTERRMMNALKIAEKADRRLADDQGSGEVHMRVANKIIEDGSWISDDVHQEYMAGLVAVSRSDGGEDDSAFYYVDLISRLTSSQIRLHCAMYGALVGTRTLETEKLSLQFDTDCPKLSVQTTVDDVSRSLTAEGASLEPGSISIALNGLHREGLVGGYSVGHTEVHGAPASPDPLVYMIPTSFGARVYQAARGSDAMNSDYLRFPGARLQPFAPEPRALEGAKIGAFQPKWPSRE